MTVIVRFAPSPTGYLHIGSARTALFNYLFAKHNGGKFLLRIEDTDKIRSTQEAVDALIHGLHWLELDHDGEIVYQSKGQSRHAEIAHELVKLGKAYYCYETTEELNILREEAKDAKQHLAFRSKWRDIPKEEYAGSDQPVIRLKVPNHGAVIVNDLVQGRVEVACDQIDDLVLLRSDGSPTYMLACVVDDHDMEITHIIRGDDHLNNTPKQILIYQAMGWMIPEFAHIPLIHGDDGAKLSKRHGALGVDAYQEMGYLPESMCNYLVRLGWSHGNDEIISRQQAIEWFDIKDINKAPSRLDFAKMDNVNSHYIKSSTNERLLTLISPILKPTDSDMPILLGAMESLKLRAKTINALAYNAAYLLISKPLNIEAEAKEIIENSSAELVDEVINLLEQQSDWSKQNIESTIKQFAADKGLKLNEIMQVLRPLITGRTVSIGVFEIISILPKSEIIARLRKRNEY